jgi:glycosyltransferase involved in cell wall biosynthesis
MNVLRPVAYYEPEKIASSHLSNDIEETFVREGFNLKIITPVPTRNVDNKIRLKYKKIKYETRRDGKVKIIRFNLMKERNNTFFRVCRYFLLIIKLYFIGKKQKDIDLIFIESTPPIQGLLGAALKKKMKKPFVYVVQDIFPESLINSGIINKKGILWKIGRKIEDFTYKHADKIVVISEKFKENIMDKGVIENKIEVISNWIDTDKVKYIDREKNFLFDKHNIDRKKFIISYCGNLGLTQNLEMVIRAAKVLSDLDNILFVFVGEGKNKDNLMKLSRELELKNLLFLPFQSYDSISEVFSIGNIGLIVSKPNVGSNSVPSKFFTMLSASQPILASFDLNTELSKQIINANCGYCVEPDNINSFVQKILDIKQMHDKLKIMGVNGRNYVQENFSKYRNTKLYIDVINDLL